eukprot:9866659-Karenia_brevis.AAC.1
MVSLSLDASAPATLVKEVRSFIDTVTIAATSEDHAEANNMVVKHWHLVDELMAAHGYECSISGRVAEELARSAHTPEQDVKGDVVEHDQNEAIHSDPQHEDTTFAHVPSSQT